MPQIKDMNPVEKESLLDKLEMLEEGFEPEPDELTKETGFDDGRVVNEFGELKQDVFDGLKKRLNKEIENSVGLKESIFRSLT